MLFNPAGLLQEQKRELSAGLAFISGVAKSPLLRDGHTATGGKAVAIPGFSYAQQLDEKQAVGIGFYGVGGSATDLQNENYRACFQSLTV